jgi:hypothetical protein
MKEGSEWVTGRGLESTQLLVFQHIKPFFIIAIILLIKKKKVGVHLYPHSLLCKL